MVLSWLACYIRKLRRKTWIYASSSLAKISRLTQACLRGPCPCKTAPNSAPDVLSHCKTPKSLQPSVIKLFSQLCIFLRSVLCLTPWQEMTKNRFCVHFQKQQSKILLTCVSHGKNYTLIYLVHLFLKTDNCIKETRKKNSAIDA